MTSLPHGLLQIMADLNAAGHETDILDYNLPDDCQPTRDPANYDLVGLSAMTTQLPHGVELAERLGNKVKIVWGGTHATIDADSILGRFPEHYVISGEGEMPLLHLIEYLEGRQDQEWLSTCKGLCYLQDGRRVINPPHFHREINTLADIDYFKLAHLERYLTSYNPFFCQVMTHVPIVVSRGCHWNCSFCINAIYRKHGGKYRAKSIQKIRREAEPLIDHFNIKVVDPRAEDFFLDRKLLDDWAAFAREKGFVWSANSRFNYFGNKLLSGEKLQELFNDGMYMMGMAIEAGTDDVRNTILNKRVTNKQIDNAIELLSSNFDASLTIGTSFIVYFPGDTKESRVGIIHWMDKIAKNLNCVFSGPQLYRSYPGSHLYAAEGKNYAGDLGYYLQEIDSTGSAIKGRYSGHFWGVMLINYYNSFYRSLQFKVDEEDRVSWEVSDQSGQLINSRNINWLMGPIRWRLRHDFWHFFWEPLLLGWLQLTYRKMQVAWQAWRPRALNNRLRVWLNTKDFYVHHKDSVKKLLHIR